MASDFSTSLLSAVAFLISFWLLYYLPHRHVTRVESSRKTLPFEVSEEQSYLTPAEARNQSSTPTLATFRSSNFDVDQALLEYQGNPIFYSVALTEVWSELMSVLMFRCPQQIKDRMEWLRILRLRRDLRGPFEFGRLPMNIFALYTILCYITVRPHMRMLRKWIFLQQDLLETGAILEREKIEKAQGIRILEFGKFNKNLKAFCTRAGIEVEYLDPPSANLYNLRKHSADRRDVVLSSIRRERDQLAEEVRSYRRINSALQTRHTIEKLVKLVPPNFKDDNGNDKRVADNATAKWHVLWRRMWMDAESPESPFHKLWKEEQGRSSKYFLERGLQLYSLMSEMIHRFQAVNEADYRDFPPIAGDISSALTPDLNNGDPNWEKERDKYKKNVNGRLEFVAVAE